MTASIYPKQLAVVLTIVMSTFSFAVQVTFQVDMQYQDVSPDGVHIAGGFQGWDSAASECTLVNDAIYAATFELNPGDYHDFKYINGNYWDTAEGVQRNITVPAEDTILDPVFFNDYEIVEGSEPVNVTFHLNTSTMPGYSDSTNTIVIRGNLNGWSGNDWELINIGGDYWSYTTVAPLEPGNYEYKYVNLGLAGDEWESTNNRYLVVTGIDGDQELPIDYFSALGPPYIETDGLDVYFRVSAMSILCYESEDLFVAGSFEGWTGILMTNEGSGDIWGLSYSFETPTEIDYRYRHGIDGWESSGIERFANITRDTTLALVYFNNYYYYDSPPEYNITFQVDLTGWLDEQSEAGIPMFSSSRGDTLEVLGNFNDWNDTDVAHSVMTRQPGTTNFYLSLESAWCLGYLIEHEYEYKYFIKHSPESIFLFESEYGLMYPDMGWEESPQNGGSNRTFNLGYSENDIYHLPMAGYYDLPAEGTIPAGQQIITTYTIDMSDADTSGFVPGDEVRLILKDKWTNYLQGFGDEAPTIASDNGDGTYTAIVTLTGPAPWHTLYVWEFVNADTTMQEGGGLGYGKYRVRYMCPSEGVWSDWDYPIDIWTEEPPLFVEDYQSAFECLGACLTDGDVTGDGTLNILDIVAMVYHILDIEPLLDDMICHGDMDTNESINIIDIVIMVDFILGLSY
ncbi:MAG: hypothetical protein HQ510_06630 [Candidatus Marinimicrobia bacterium]|nr:hypothetical protein [Candidatus Neomarinimicrobiota bacterium]